MLSIIRPMNGIESNKYQPIVRQLQNVKVQISPCVMSPLAKKVLSKPTEKKSVVASTSNQQI